MWFCSKKENINRKGRKEGAKIAKKKRTYTEFHRGFTELHREKKKLNYKYRILITEY
jgi:hypothetical protein